ncbi:MAG: hypothetical protein KC431_29305 [Myxococcales bacterium]|nr:hypothetical protein [Myxococcales bacterium]
MAAPTLLPLTGVLLRAPEQLLADPHGDRQHSDDGDRLAVLAPQLLALIVIGGATLGFVLGSYRGHLQYVYAAIKTPLLLLLPVLVGLPAIRAFHDACELSLSWSRLALAALLAVARTAVLAAAVAPILWLYLSMHPGYHDAVLAMAACLALVGVPGLWTLTRSLPSGGRNRPLATVASVAVLGVLLAQSGWLLRPFVVRPRAEISFLRPIEANVFSSLASTGASAKGHYGGWDARGGGLFGRGQSTEVEVHDFEVPALEVPDFEAPALDTTALELPLPQAPQPPAVTRQLEHTDAEPRR